MALEDVVQVTITRETSAVERAGFGVLLHLSMHRAWSDRIRYYTRADDMLDDGFSDTDEGQRAASSYFRQDPKPQRIAIGRLATGDTVTVFVDEVANSTRYTIYIDGIGFAFTSDATATTTEIEAGLTSIVNAGYAITAVSTANDSFTIAGSHVADFPAGKQFRVDGSTGNDGTYTVVSAVLDSGSTVITVEEDVTSAVADGFVKSKTPVTATDSGAGDGFLVVDPDVASTFFEIRTGSRLHTEFVLADSLAQDLEAIEDEDATGWYGVALSHQFGASQKDRQRDLADAVETRRKLLIVATADADVIDTTVSGDDPDTGTIARQLQAVQYARSAVLFGREADNELGDDDENPDPFSDAAWFGARFTTDPGRETWKFATLRGVTPDNLTATQRSNALAKNANVYVPVTSSISMTEEGKVAEGEFLDVIRFVDFLHSELTSAVFDALINPPAPLVKVPYTDAGIAVVENAVRMVLQAAVDSGGLASFTVSVPAAADVPAADKAARVLRNVTFVGVLSGAIHSVQITGTVSV